MAHLQINSLQIGRAIAAISVVVLHSTMATEYFVQKAPSNFLLFSSHGYLGVDFFFVLSGFIIYHIHRDDDRSFTAFLNYLKKRISRSYAPYLPISVFLIVTYLLFPALSASQRQWE